MGKPAEESMKNKPRKKGARKGAKIRLSHKNMDIFLPKKSFQKENSSIKSCIKIILGNFHK